VLIIFLHYFELACGDFDMVTPCLIRCLYVRTFVRHGLAFPGRKIMMDRHIIVLISTIVELDQAQF